MLCALLSIGQLAIRLSTVALGWGTGGVPRALHDDSIQRAATAWARIGLLIARVASFCTRDLATSVGILLRAALWTPLLALHWTELFARRAHVPPLGLLRGLLGRLHIAYLRVSRRAVGRRLPLWDSGRLGSRWAALSNSRAERLPMHARPDIESIGPQLSLIVDSGCVWHVIMNRDLLINTRPCFDSMFGADGEDKPCSVIGDLTLVRAKSW
eukprot:900360-Prymnesium_polylepis.2